MIAPGVMVTPGVGAAWFVIPFALCVALLLWAVNQFLSRLTIVLDDQEVRWCRHSLRRTTESVDPMSGFDGIRGQDRFSNEDGVSPPTHVEWHGIGRALGQHGARRGIAAGVAAMAAAIPVAPPRRRVIPGVRWSLTQGRSGGIRDVPAQRLLASES